MNQIEHDPNEPKIDRSMKIYWIAAIVLALLWIGQWYFDGFDWEQIMLGLGTGILLTAWAIDVSGNKIPESWRRKN